jgi:cytochrome b pre-mRNA-processing protein 3
MREAGVEGREAAQDITDEFFRDVEHSLRELGIGDQGVPRRMKKLARMFYGRAMAYGAALDAGDVAALADALARNVWPDADHAGHAEALAAHVMAAWKELGSQPLADILSGRVRFIAPAAGEVV